MSFYFYKILFYWYDDKNACMTFFSSEIQQKFVNCLILCCKEPINTWFLVKLFLKNGNCWKTFNPLRYQFPNNFWDFWTVLTKTKKTHVGGSLHLLSWAVYNNNKLRAALCIFHLNPLDFTFHPQNNTQKTVNIYSRFYGCET